jgi:hypothetical protein
MVCFFSCFGSTWSVRQLAFQHTPAHSPKFANSFPFIFFRTHLQCKKINTFVFNSLHTLQAKIPWVTCPSEYSAANSFPCYTSEKPKGHSSPIPILEHTAMHSPARDMVAL